ncbi:MAG: penicillin acylase family protein [Acidobacteriaceae bacterium]|nr:penicillin acylase family protein [Acidobacteriaceae bacterium]
MRASLAAALMLVGASAVFVESAATEIPRQQRTLSGLKAAVEILRDRWGVPHIYAQNTDDLFFAQGYITANDRLFQLDLWRRIGTGKLAEVLGPNYVPRDRIARLMRYRGDWDAEWRSYAPDAKVIVSSFVDGINAYIRSLNGQRPEEFQLAGFDPGLWTPEDVVSRVAGLQMTGNMLQEVNRAVQVSHLGLSAVELLSPPDPPVPFVVPHGLDLADISFGVVRDYMAAIGPIRFPGQQGSNNWVIDGTLSRTGKPLLANDPHRAIQLPSLRKTVHLVAPGWDVIGAGEPALPGIALGHNEYMAFGFTIVGIDQQDLYVEKVNPENPNEYLCKGAWQKFRVEHETIDVRGGGANSAGSNKAESEPFDLKFTVHGPVIYEDATRHRAYTLKWVGSLPGTAGYLPALSLARAKNWDEFKSAAANYKVPSENLIYADKRGNIGWIAAGLAPIRSGWEGLFPVPGDTGEYEWSGYLNAAEHPLTYDPAKHFIATANNNILPQGYEHQLAFYWASPERYQRVVEELTKQPKFDIADFERIQQDTVSLVAKDFGGLVAQWNPPSPDNRTFEMKRLFENWDGDLSLDSKTALIYEVWSSRLSSKLTLKVLPMPRTNPRSVIAALKNCPQLNELLAKSLDEALAEIERRLGPDQTRWTWGNLHKARFRHPLNLGAAPEGRDASGAGALAGFGLDSAATSRERRLDTLDLKPISRPGDANTINATGGGPNYSEAFGASYREVIDVSDWDRSEMTNAPGESGVPGNKHYSDLVEPWAKGEYHPMPFSRTAVERAAEEQIMLVPR